MKPPKNSARQFSSKSTNTLVIIKQPTQGSTWDWIIPKTSPKLRSHWDIEYVVEISVNYSHKHN